MLPPPWQRIGLASLRFYRATRMVTNTTNPQAKPSVVLVYDILPRNSDSPPEFIAFIYETGDVSAEMVRKSARPLKAAAQLPIANPMSPTSAAQPTEKTMSIRV